MHAFLIVFICLKIKLKLLSKLTYAQCLHRSASSVKFLFQLFVFFPGDSLFSLPLCLSLSGCVYVVVSDSSFVSICNLNPMCVCIYSTCGHFEFINSTTSTDRNDTPVCFLPLKKCFTTNGKL